MAKQSRRDIRALLLALSADLSVQIGQRLDRLGLPHLRPPQSQLLTAIEADGMRLTDLVDVLGLPKQTLGDMVAELERQKLVERYADPDHGVIKRVRLTARGRAWMAELHKVSESTEARWTQLVGKTKMKSFRGLLEELSEEVSPPLASSNGALATVVKGRTRQA